MSSVPYRSDFRAPAIAAPAASKTRRTPWRWLYDAVMLSRERQTKHEVDRLVGRRGGAFTDALERRTVLRGRFEFPPLTKSRAIKKSPA